MSQIKTDGSSVPVDHEHDPEVLAFRGQFDARSPLHELSRKGTKRMLQSAVDVELEALIAQHADAVMTAAGNWSSKTAVCPPGRYSPAPASPFSSSRGVFTSDFSEAHET